MNDIECTFKGFIREVSACADACPDSGSCQRAVGDCPVADRFDVAAPDGFVFCQGHTKWVTRWPGGLTVQKFTVKPAALFEQEGEARIEIQRAEEKPEQEIECRPTAGTGWVAVRTAVLKHLPYLLAGFCTIGLTLIFLWLLYWAGWL